MRKQLRCTISLLFMILLTFSAASADVKQTKEEIRTKCNAAGGELLGVSESGSYGCEGKGGGMVLCNKNEDCKIYPPESSVTGISVEDAISGDFWRAEAHKSDKIDPVFPIGLLGVLGLAGLLGLKRRKD